MKDNRMVVLAAMVAALVVTGRVLVGAQPFDGPRGEGRRQGQQQHRMGGEEGFGDEDARIMGEFKRHPKLQKRLKRMRKQRPDEFRRKMRGMRGMMRDPKLRKIMIENLKLEQEGRELTKAYREEDDGKKKSEIKGKLKSVIEKQFDAKLKGHEQRIKDMEEKIGKMKERLTKRRKARKDIIEKRLGKLTGDEESWEW